MDNAFIPSTWRRLSAKGVDQLITLLLYIPFAGTVIRLIFTDDPVIIPLSTFVVYLLVPTFYEIIFLVVMQATVGKWLFGMKVVPNHDPSAKLTWQQCLLRPVTGILSLFFGMAIYATAFFRYDRTHVADWVAETRVVQDVPRVRPAKIRWLVGIFFILFFTFDSLSTARSVLKGIDWHNRKVDLRSFEEISSGRDLYRQYEDGAFEEE